MANVTGEAVEQVSSYMTAIWNNFNKAGDESAEHYGDIMTLLGAETAASSEEIAGGLEKFASIGNTIGLSFDYAASAVTTIVDRTRESEDTVGNALKTIFSRMESLKLGETLEDGTDLNKYSKALKTVGIDIKDATGELKDMDQIIDEVGAKWGELGRNERVALAQTVAGTMQYTRFMALFDHFDFFENLVDLSKNAEGTLEKQNEIYAESWEAASNRVRAAFEGIWQDVIDDKFFIKLTNNIANVVEAIGTIIDSVGGLKPILLAVSTIMLKAFGDNIAESIRTIGLNLKFVTKKGREQVYETQKKSAQELIDRNNNSGADALSSDIYKRHGDQLFALIEKEKELREIGKEINEEDKKRIKNLMDQNLLLGEQIIEGQKENDIRDKQNQELIDDTSNKVSRRLSNRYDQTTTPDEKQNFKQYVGIYDSSKNAKEDNKRVDLFKKDLESYDRQSKAYYNYQEALNLIKEKSKNIMNTGISGEISQKIMQNNPGDSDEAKSKRQSEEKLEIFKQQSSKLSNLQKEVQSLLNTFDDLGFEMKDLGIDSKKLAELFNNLENNGVGKFENAIKELETEMNKAEKSLNKKGSTLNQKGRELSNSFNDNVLEDINKNNRKTAEKNREMSKERDVYEQNANDNEEEIKGLEAEQPGKAEGVVALGEAFLSLEMAISSVTGAYNTLMSSEATVFEKMSALFMAIGMGIPSIVNLVKSFQILKAVWIGEVVPGAAAVIASLIGVEITELQTMTATEILKKSLSGLYVMLAPFLPIIILITGTLALLTIAIVKNHQATHKQREEYEDLKTVSEDTSAALDGVKNSIDELNTSLDEIDDKKEALKNLQSGTAEWRKEVGELNEEILDSIDSFNNLNNILPDNKQEKAKKEIAKKIKEEGAGDKKASDINLDLEEGTDYYTDSEGVLQYTKIGEIKVETINSMVVEEATIQSMNAKIAEKESEADARLEELLGQEIKTNESPFEVQSQTGSMSSPRTRAVSSLNDADRRNVYNQLDSDVARILTNALSNNLIREDELNNANKIGAVLEANGSLTKETIESQKKLIASTETLQAGLKQTGQLRQEVNSYIQTTMKTRLSDDEIFQGKLKDFLSDDYKKYKTYIRDQAAEDIQTTYRSLNDLATEKGLNNSEVKNKLFDGQSWKNYRQEFSNQSIAYGMQDGKYYKKDSSGKIDTSQEVDEDVFEEALTQWRALDVAYKDVTKSAKQYNEVLKNTKESLQGLKELKKSWTDWSESIKGAGKTLDSAGDKVKNWKKLLKDGTDEQKKAAKTFDDYADSVRDSAGQLLNMDLDKSIFNGKFLNENKATWKDIVESEGADEKAVQKLENAYNVEKYMKMSTKTNEEEASVLLRMDFDEEGSLKKLRSKMTSTREALQASLKDLKVGIELDEDQISKANQMLSSVVGTQQDALDALDEMGISADVEQVEVDNGTSSGFFENIEMQKKSLPIPNFGTVSSVGSLVKGISAGVKSLKDGEGFSDALDEAKVEFKEMGTTDIYYPTFKKGDSVKTSTKNADQTIGIWKIKTGKGAKTPTYKGKRKIGSGGSSKSKDNTTTPPSQRGPGSSGSRTPSRSSRSSTPKRASRKSSSSKYTRYKEIDDTMSRLSKATERQVKLEDQLYGKKKLDAMKQVNKNLQAELKAIQKKRKEARAYSIIDKNNLQKDLKEAEKNVADAIKKLNKENKNKKSAKLKFTPITEFTFNKYGEITNYTKIMKGIDAQLKSLYKTYNKIKSGDVQSTFYEKRIQPLEEAMSQIEAAVKQYDETRELMIELQEQWNEKYLELLDKNFENLSYQVELKLELTEGSKKLIDYFASKLESDAYKIGELFSYTFTKTYENINDSVAAYTDKNYQLPEGGDKLTYLENIQKQYERGTITQAKYVEGLKEERDALLEQAQSYIELNNKMSNWYEDSLSKVQEELNRYTQNIEQAVSAMEHMKNVLDLSGESKDYNKLLNYQNRIVGLAQQQYEISLKNYEARQNELKILDDEAKKSTYNEDQQKEYEKQRQNLINQINQAGEEVLSNYETILQGAQTLLETQLEKANKAIDDFLSDTVGGFDELLDQMDRTSNRQDEYLTKTNQIYEMNKMLRTLRQDMDKSDNKAAKQRMKNFENELTSLKEKGELSQLELQIAQARYEQLKAQIALEEAQNAKQTVRLRRDNEGNYGYVYTANEDQINDAEQTLDDANNSLYNIYLEASNNYNQKIIDQTQSLLSKLQDIENSDLSKEEKQQLRETAIAQYKELINTSAKLAEIGQNGLKIDFGASGEDWVSKYTGPVQKILGNLDGSLKEYLEKIDSANEDYQKIYNKYFEQTNKIAENIYNTSQNSWKKLMGEDGDSGILRKLNNEMLEQVKKVSAWLEKLAIILAKIGNLEDLLKDLNKDITAENTGENAIASNTNYNQLLNDIATNGQNGKISSTDFSKDNDAARVFTDDKGNVMSFNAVAKAMKKNSKIQAYNEKVAKTLIEEKTKGAHGLLGYNSDGELVYVTTNSPMTDSTVKKLKDQLAKKIGGNEKLQKIKNAESYLNKYWSEQSKKPKTSKGKTNRKENMKKYKKAYENIIKDVISSKNQEKYLFGKNLTKEEKKKILSRLSKRESAERNNYWKKSNHEFVQFKTGGYTGDWGGQNGKLAMLHQKEMVLNKDDTKNLLASVDVIRGIVSSIDLQALSRQYGSNVSSQNLTNFNGNNLQQDVRISAEFPNVRDRNEIEAAFDNLVNRAAQYANRRV